MPFDLSPFRAAAAAIEDGGIHEVTSLRGSSGTLLLSLLKSPFLLLCATESLARTASSDLLFWSEVFQISPPILLPPAGDSARFRSFTHLYGAVAPRFVASLDAAQSPLWMKGEYPRVRVTRGLVIERDIIAVRFVSQGYRSVPIVSAEGEMSLRGGIMDIFPPDQVNPLRIEFFGDEVESIRSFDIDSQLSIEETHEVQICPAAEPEEGPTLIDLLDDRLIVLQEPDDLRRITPALDDLLGNRRSLEITALPVSGRGMEVPVSSPGGRGLLRDERRDMETFVQRSLDLRDSSFILLVSSSESQAKRLKELFYDQNADLPLVSKSGVLKPDASPVVTVGDMSSGFAFGDVIVLSEREIFGRRPSFRPVRKSRVSSLITSIEDFREGDHLVHVEHGIGRFLGLRKEKIEGYEGDFITIEYLGGDRLYVPLDGISVVQKYNAPEGVKPKIDRLGGRTWQKTRGRIRKKIRDMAERLVSMYARRTQEEGAAFSVDTELHREFDGFFPYEETPDQVTSVKEIKADMEKPEPMDRLLCGDVGYGKTEVVMRACFKAVYDGKQVAVLVPTTILAEQHFETFTARFSAFPVKIDFLSRFKNRAEQKRTVEALAAGDIDIVIGTHKLLAKDITYHDLGLLIVDEEHKFGVAHKEKLKSLKLNVDVLTLSATPIPRTLHMALSGIRAMSVIETPPEDRLAVKSTVARFDPRIIQEAMTHELDRGGQVFFVHNRIQDIYEIANFIQRLLPGAKTGVAHGQMKERELERVMRDFFHQNIQILVSTAIIGSGLDVPSANTIIINRADRFGLADLYQLRGRVGRSNIKAYAYFFIPGSDAISAEARKKLQAIQELGYLGAGFRLALKDLEIRGAGNLLGAEQSGHIAAVGFDMYMEMLEAAVAELKGEERPPRIEPAIELQITAFISEEYIEDPDIRLSIYRKIGAVSKAEDLHRLRDELKDRFGPLPEKAGRLLEIMELKVHARALMISEIRGTAGKVRVFFAAQTPVAPHRVLQLHESRRGRIRFLPEGGFEIDLRGRPWGTVFSELKEIMQELGTETER